VTRERSATRAFVLGLLSLLFGVLSPFAIWAGALALYRIRTGPGNLTGEGFAVVGLVAGFVAFTFSILGIVFWWLAS
jgi:hypothetical protein